MLKAILCAIQPQLATTLYGSDTMESEGDETTAAPAPTTGDELAEILQSAVTVLPVIKVETPVDEYGALRKDPLSPEERRATLKHLFPKKEPCAE